MFIKQELNPDKIYDLLLNSIFVKLSMNPGLIRQELSKIDKLIVVDEIQKLPVLLDEIHYLIENSNCRFLLTGSSARKLKRGKASLLGGRARIKRLFPFSFEEISDNEHLQDLSRILQFGLLPPVYLSLESWEDLKDYVGTYLKEEIQAEALSRKIENFCRFLIIAAKTNAEIINFNSVAQDAQIPPRTIIEYYHILEDTLLGTFLKPFKINIRKAYSKSKIYFFDTGIVHALLNKKELSLLDYSYGKAIEHYIFLELRKYIEYRNKDEQITYLRTYNGVEIDFIIDDNIAIEVKSTKNVTYKHYRNLKVICKNITFKRKIIVSNDERKRIIVQFTDSCQVLCFAFVFCFLP